MARALAPTLPAPRMTTLPGGTPSRPGSSTPLPPFCFCRHHAPTCTASRPAIADIGERIGRPHPWPTGLKAMEGAPLAGAASRNGGPGAESWEPEKGLPPQGLRGLVGLRFFSLEPQAQTHGM